jgi:hypothetical protein
MKYTMTPQQWDAAVARERALKQGQADIAHAFSEALHGATAHEWASAAADTLDEINGLTLDSRDDVAEVARMLRRDAAHAHGLAEWAEPWTPSVWFLRTDDYSAQVEQLERAAYRLRNLGNHLEDAARSLDRLNREVRAANDAAEALDQRHPADADALALQLNRSGIGQIVVEGD